MCCDALRSIGSSCDLGSHCSLYSTDNGVDRDALPDVTCVKLALPYCSPVCIDMAFNKQNSFLGIIVILSIASNVLGQESHEIVAVNE